MKLIWGSTSEDFWKSDELMGVKYLASAYQVQELDMT